MAFIVMITNFIQSYYFISFIIIDVYVIVSIMMALIIEIYSSLARQNDLEKK
jgi:hypothetical protein